MDSGKSFTDFSLIQALRSEPIPDAAINYLYRNNYLLTAAYIRQNNGSEQDAEDIFQEVILVFIEIVKKDKFRGESSISTFLYSITRNIWLNELKKRDRSRYRDEVFEKSRDPMEMDVSHYMMDKEIKSQLMLIMESLGETCKRILLAFYFQKLSMREILKTLEYENEQVVRNKKYKCLKQLEQLIAGQAGLAKSLKSLL